MNREVCALLAAYAGPSSQALFCQMTTGTTCHGVIQAHRLRYYAKFPPVRIGSLMLPLYIHKPLTPQNIQNNVLELQRNLGDCNAVQGLPEYSLVTNSLFV